jgi:Asp-tRNA(Asn)/Glu-tRNA(Gln) amidotransferase A subunit family amidase
VDVFVTMPGHDTTNFTGHPVVITRCGILKGELQAVQFVGGIYQEATALRLAYAYEQATPWRRQWPDMSKIKLSEGATR